MHPGETVWSPEQIVKAVNDEFGFVYNRLMVFVRPAVDLYSDSTREVNSPGVYVHWHPKYGAIKVGKSNSNSKKRAREHLRDNTSAHGKLDMTDLKGDSSAKLILFNVSGMHDIHWVLAIEAFLELRISPLIAAGRVG
jgi:hypothetical protein